MTTAAQRIEALMQIHPKGFDLSLDRIRGLLEKLGNPQDRLPPVIHVAGTNGKGSTIAFCRSILEAAGLAVHVDTSPHLVHWNERYRMGRKGAPGQFVDDETFSEAIARVAEANGGQAITVFEILTAVAFILFSEHPADVCLVEVGLGGRFDSTNVMNETTLSVITPVSIDHESFLGDTLAKIAFEKAGIIRRATPLVIGLQEDEALAVIEQQAARNRAPAQTAGEHYSAHRENGRMVYQDEQSLLDLPLPRLKGEHQIANAATAIAACRWFCRLADFDLDENAIATGLENVYWPGRMQALPRGRLHEVLKLKSGDGADGDHAVWPEIWLDGGHNPGAARALANLLADVEERDPRPCVMICGMLNTKDPRGYFEELASLVQEVVTVPIISSDAGIDPAELATIASECGLPSRAATSLEDALLYFNGTGSAPPDLREPLPRLLIAGSLYLVGDALEQNGTPPQ